MQPNTPMDTTPAKAALVVPRVRRAERNVPSAPDPLWYKHAIIYELHVRSFCDGSADGVGDFPGLISKLDYLQDLGVTAIWLLPFYPSPLRDDGYDIADYLSVNPSYGVFRDVQRFIREAHARGLKVITELVVNHTSDQHAWFQRARQAPRDSRFRNFYVWSDTPDRYTGARIIFKDFETSNWAWDPVAKQYYWHRFYSHQPDLNFDNPEVQDALMKVCDHWFETGVDGMRLDAVPYLYEREGSNCENLPETHAFLRKLRAHVDRKYPGRMLLAEANQWPEDAVAYFGQEDECHMAFHFPLMPRLFMAIRMEDRFPIIDILEQTPPIPERSQWALFLRNHDELTLEMVTDEERDYMYRVYAGDREARINLGIRRRLAPLLGNNRRKIELMNALMVSLPGTPVLYYGDEIGMGDNVYLGDRDGVRTPMQWSADRNAGFSKAGPQRLFLPVIIDPEYHYETVNVESQQANPSSLLWWMKRLLALRKRHPVFGHGQMEFLQPTNSKVLAFVRTSEEDTVLVLANLSRFAQPTHVDLSRYRDLVPVEMFGRTRFPAITDQPYFLTLGPHSFYWFLLRPAAPESEAHPEIRTLRIDTNPEEWAASPAAWTALAAVLAIDIPRRRWFGSKGSTLRGLRIVDAVPIQTSSTSPRAANLLIVQVEYADHEAETYAVPVATCAAGDADQVLGAGSTAVIAILRDRDDKEWILYDAMRGGELPAALLSAIARARTQSGVHGEIVASRTRAFGPATAAASLPVRIGSAEQSNSSALYGDRFIIKHFRRLETGINPDLEISTHLTQRVGFPHTPPLAGTIEYRAAGTESRTLALLQQFVPNEGDAWTFTLNHLSNYYDRAFALDDVTAQALWEPLPPSALEAAAIEPPGGWGDLLGDFVPAIELLGRRTAEMHAALANDQGDPAFTPEPYSPHYQRSLTQSMRNTVRRTFQTLRRNLELIPAEARADAEELLQSEDKAIAFFQTINALPVSTMRIRCHGDYHLGQVLWTGKDFVIIDFEGEPLRSLGERRLKRSALRDVAGLIRSLQYAAATGLRKHLAQGAGEEANRGGWARAWQVMVGGAFLREYIATVRALAPSVLPEETSVLHRVLNVWLLEKALYETTYELNSRPTWVGIPLSAVRELLSRGI